MRGVFFPQDPNLKKKRVREDWQHFFICFIGGGEGGGEGGLELVQIFFYKEYINKKNIFFGCVFSGGGGGEWGRGVQSKLIFFTKNPNLKKFCRGEGLGDLEQVNIF